MKDNKRDKRVLIPRDEFEEEAGEGLGRLSRDEAEADLRELRARLEGRSEMERRAQMGWRSNMDGRSKMGRRLRRPRAIWLPAAAAVVILLVGSALLVTMLRQRSVHGPELAQTEEAVTDTAYIAMAEPVGKTGIGPDALVSEGSAGGKAGGTANSTSDVRTKEAKFGPLLSVTAEAVDEEKVAEAVIADDEAISAVSEVSEDREAADDVVFLVVQEGAEEVVVDAVPQMKNAAMKARAETADRAAVPAAGAVSGAGMPDRLASPVGGWSGYREWVLRNISYPDDVRPVVRQEVMVSFTVRPDSTLSDLKALRSPGEAFTGEALRLLREGPKWVPASQGGKVMAAEVKVMFVFK